MRLTQYKTHYHTPLTEICLPQSVWNMCEVRGCGTRRQGLEMLCASAHIVPSDLVPLWGTADPVLVVLIKLLEAKLGLSRQAVVSQKLHLPRWEQ